MQDTKISRSLSQNLQYLRLSFGASGDFYAKELTICGVPCAIVMFTGLSSPEKLCHLALDLLDHDLFFPDGSEGLCDYLLTQSRAPSEPRPVTDWETFIEMISNGMSLLLIDGCSRAVVFSTQEMPQRSVGTPTGEGNMRGSQEAFTELLRNNLSLLRRQFRSGTLVAEIATAKTRAKTEYCLCYDRLLAPKETIDALRKQLADLELPVLLDRLTQFIQPWFPGNTELNRSRCQILHQCLDFASSPRGIYTLTVPTGGGKTVSSLAFALKHAVAHGLSRVIYVIPYTSIIEQNAEVFREILGKQNVVEHHCAMQADADLETDLDNQFQRLAAENWDAPVIVTTAVQFFESLYSNRPSQCRKLHNVANSVIIFDEAQMLPASHLSPCIGAISNLTSHFRSTVVLCTATQPVLSDLVHSFCPELRTQEICPQTEQLYKQFQRVTYRQGGKLSHSALASQMISHKQVLCRHRRVRQGFKCGEVRCTGGKQRLPCVIDKIPQRLYRRRDMPLGQHL